MATYRRVTISASIAPGYGLFYLKAKYRGKDVKVITSNTRCIDWLEDSSDKVKNSAAKKYAYKCIVHEYAMHYQQQLAIKLTDLK